MKLKLKFDKKTLLDFLLQNVEKIVFGIVALIFLSMLYSSLTKAARFEKTPEQLQAEVAKGRREIEQTTFDGYISSKTTEASGAPGAAATPGPTGAQPGAPAGVKPPAMPGLTIPDYVKQAKGIRVTIEEKPYANTAAWDSPIFSPKRLRTAPAVFTVQKLRGAAGMGAFRIMTEATEEAAEDERPRTTRRGRDNEGGGVTPVASRTEQSVGQRWIVVTGLVPIKNQEAAYSDAFLLSPGYDAKNDYPRYIGYWVQRLEVTGNEEPDWSKATEFLSRKTVDAAQKKWASGRESDVVSPKYLDSALVFPLGPLTSGNWDADVAYDPEIPILKSGSSNRGAGMMMDGPGGMRQPSTRRMGGMEGGAMPGGRMAGTGREDVAEDTPFDAETTDKDKKTNGTASKELEDEDKPATNLLFRFFDFDVEPGKRYIYRVRLALRNPNADVKVSYLAKPELKDKKWLETKWSEPTEPTAVLRDTRVFLASVKPGRPNVDPSAEVLITTWLKAKGIEIYKEFTVTRGLVANFADQTGKAVGGNNVGGGGGGIMRATPMARPRGGGLGLDDLGPGGGMGRATTTTPSDDSLKGSFLTGATTVDIRGGEKLPGVTPRKPSNLSASGELLLLDADGVLVVHNELDEQSTRELIAPADAPAAATPTRPTRDLMPRAGAPGARDAGVRGGATTRDATRGGATRTRDAAAPRGGGLDALDGGGATTRRRPAAGNK